MSLTVYLLPLPTGVAPPTRSAEASAIVAASRSSEGPVLRRATSQNGWHSELAGSLARAWSIEGLDFLSAEVVVLSPHDASMAKKAIMTLLEQLEARHVPRTAEMLGHQWQCIMSQATLPEELMVALVMEPVDVNEEHSETSSFVRFLVIVLNAATEAAERAQHLLYFRRPC